MRRWICTTRRRSGKLWKYDLMKRPVRLFYKPQPIAISRHGLWVSLSQQPHENAQCGLPINFMTQASPRSQWRGISCRTSCSGHEYSGEAYWTFRTKHEQSLRYLSEASLKCWPKYVPTNQRQHLFWIVWFLVLISHKIVNFVFIDSIFDLDLYICNSFKQRRFW